VLLRPSSIQTLPDARPPAPGGEAPSPSPATAPRPQPPPPPSRSRAPLQPLARRSGARQRQGDRRDPWRQRQRRTRCAHPPQQQQQRRHEHYPGVSRPWAAHAPPPPCRRRCGRFCSWGRGRTEEGQPHARTTRRAAVAGTATTQGVGGSATTQAAAERTPRVLKTRAETQRAWWLLRPSLRGGPTTPWVGSLGRSGTEGCVMPMGTAPRCRRSSIICRRKCRPGPPRESLQQPGRGEGRDGFHSHYAPGPRRIARAALAARRCCTLEGRGSVSRHPSLSGAPPSGRLRPREPR